MDDTRQDAQGAAPPAEVAGTGELDALMSGIVRTGPWTRFMAVMGFIGAGLMAIGGLIIILAGGSMGELGAGVGILVGLFYIAMAAIYLIPVLPLNRFASEASRLRENRSLARAAGAIEQGRSFWMRLGVLTIIGLALLPVALVISIIVAVLNK